MRFGGAQDLSGVFASLIGSYQADVESDVAAARRRAEAEEAAEDQEVYAKWKAGKISDDEWLGFLAKRRDEALEPEEKSKWSEMLLEHTGAIEDAQAEANFAMGKITLGALMKHYSRRMASVERESPAWREMASRYGQLSQASGGYGGGGYGGGGSGSSNYDPQSVVDAGADALGGSMFKGIHTGGDDFVDPTSSMVAIEDDDDFINALLTDIERIKSLEDWMEEHPEDRTVIDEFTGETFEITPDFLLGLDKQYIRSEQALAAAYWARGGTEDAKKAAQALGHATDWVAGPMTRHNTLSAEPRIQSLEQAVYAQLVAASAISDPDERQKVYAGALAQVEKFARTTLAQPDRRYGIFTPRPGSALAQAMPEALRPQDSELPDALRPDESIYSRVDNLYGMLDLGANWRNYTPEEINARANEILSSSASLGTGGASISIKTLLEGGGGDGTPVGFVGLLENMTQSRGLAAGEALLRGEKLPAEFQGPNAHPIYTYQYDGTVTRPVVADVRDQANAFGGVSPVLVPQGADPDAVVMTRVKINGKTQTVWVQPQPVDDPRFRVYRATQAFDTFRAGDLITSAALAKIGSPRLQQLVAQGQVQADSVVSAIALPGGVTWFRDNETGQWHTQPPITVTTDATTGGVLVDDDGDPEVNHEPFAAGVMVPFSGVRGMEMERWLKEAVALGQVNPAEYRQRGAGGELVDILSLDNMYVPPPVKGPRAMNPKIVETLRDRSRSSLEEFEQSNLYARTLNHPTDQAEVERNAVESARETAERLGIRLGGSGLAATRSKYTETGETEAPRFQIPTYEQARMDYMEAIAARNSKTPPVKFTTKEPKPMDVPQQDWAPVPNAPIRMDPKPVATPPPAQSSGPVGFDPKDRTPSSSSSSSSSGSATRPEMI